MFETADLGHATSQAEYVRSEPALRVGLLSVQYELQDAHFPGVLVLAGTDRLGCVEVINLLHEWMVPRYLEANVFEAASDEELARPTAQRIFSATDRIAPHCDGYPGAWSKTIRTARSRNSGEYLLRCPMGPALPPNGPSDKAGTVHT